MKSIAIIGTNGLPGRYGGWDQLLNHITFYLGTKYQIIVYTSSHNSVKGLKTFNGAKIKIVHLKANGYQSVFYDGFSLFHAAIHYDVLLIFGTSGCIFLPIIKLFRKKLILNPDGAEWKRGKWNFLIKFFLKFSEYLGIKFADIVISDNKIIQDYIYNYYKKSSILIEYGGDHVLEGIGLSKSVSAKYNIHQNSYAFKVCRIEPENNIEMILNSFSKIDYDLLIIGNWNSSSFGRNLRIKYSMCRNIKMLEPIYQQYELDELRANCALYIHGHSVGGTNPSLVEAMHLSLFCVVFDVDYNRETTESSTVYFNSADSLISIVKKFINNEIPTVEIKSRLKKIAMRRYKWFDIINKYEKQF
jgi:glycosyltransferase involved in cell wall biosynthesis